MIGDLRQTIGNHLVGREMLQADLSIAYVVPDGMISYGYMLRLRVINRIVSDLYGALVILINGSRSVMINGSLSYSI